MRTRKASTSPQLESLECRTLLSGLPYPTAANVTQLIADINYANTTGGALGNSRGGSITLCSIAQHWNANFALVGPNALNLGNGNVTLGATPTLTVSPGISPTVSRS